MNRRERRAFDRMSQKEFQKVRDYTLKQLKEKYPDKQFTEEDFVNAQSDIKNLINQEQQFK